MTACHRARIHRLTHSPGSVSWILIIPHRCYHFGLGRLVSWIFEQADENRTGDRLGLLTKSPGPEAPTQLGNWTH